MSKLTEYFVSNPVALDPGDLGITTENTGTTPATGSFKYSQLMTNRYKITPTVVSNDLVLALKHEDGNDPSTDRPLYFKIGNSLRAVTAATSITKADGTNWANLGSAEFATKEADLFAYLVWNTTHATDKVDIFWSRVPYGTVFSDFSATTTAETYASAGATVPAATDECIVIGRFAATLSAGAGYTWTVPTYTNKNLIQRPIYKTRRLSYTPTLSDVTMGNSTLTGQYIIDEDKCRFSVYFLRGSTGSVTGAVTVKYPFSVVGSPGNNNVVFVDAGTAQYFGVLYASTATAGFVLVRTTGSTYESLLALSSTVPFTWATNDEIQITDAEIWIR